MFEDCWLKILQNEGEIFNTKTDMKFTYRIIDDKVKPNRTNWFIPKEHIRTVYKQWPIYRLSQINNKVSGASYIWGILNDSRIINLPNRDQIEIGTFTIIETKENQGTGKFIDGVVKQILTTSNSHPYGIKVKLQNNQVGRVKYIGKLKNKHSNSLEKDIKNTFEDLLKKKIPQMEDENNEFKEFYQYDSKIEKLPVSMSKEEKIVAKKEMTYSAQETFANAICSFGNSYSGGFVYLGIKSDGKILGLERDKKFKGFTNYDDSFANDIVNKLELFLDDKVFITTNVRIKFRNVDDKTICMIQVLPAITPLWVQTKNIKKFFVRGSAPRAQNLDSKEQVRYIKARFPDFN